MLSEFELEFNLFNDIAPSESEPNWSVAALENYGPNNMHILSSEIVGWYKNAAIGMPFNNDAENYPLPLLPDRNSAKKYIADIYIIELSDIDIMVDMAD